MIEVLCLGQGGGRPKGRAGTHVRGLVYLGRPAASGGPTTIERPPPAVRVFAEELEQA